jgi:hypothetical protein
LYILIFKFSDSRREDRRFWTGIVTFISICLNIIWRPNSPLEACYITSFPTGWSTSIPSLVSKT